MVLRKYRFSREEVDNLVLVWLNQLSVAEMDQFFWDYPGHFGYSERGYGLGRTTAGRIAETRSGIAPGFGSIQEVMNVPGVGPDKISDMRIQAREALALAEYHGVPKEPIELWNMLFKEGPGVPLSQVTEQLKKSLKTSTDYLSKAVKSGTTQVLLKMPFVALAWVKNGEDENQVSVNQFIRVRIQPWALAAHSPDYIWSLNMKYIPDNNYHITLKKGI